MTVKPSYGYPEHIMPGLCREKEDGPVKTFWRIIGGIFGGFV